MVHLQGGGELGPIPHLGIRGEVFAAVGGYGHPQPVPTDGYLILPVHLLGRAIL